MDVFETEEQQLETLRNWWKTNGMSVVLGAVLGVAAIGGWKYWQHYQLSKAQAASDAYEEVIKISETADKSAEFKQKAEALSTNFKGTVYADFSQLFLAREAVKENDLPRAAGYLQDLVEHANHAAIKHEATLRLARVKLAQNDAEGALKLVQKDKKDTGEFAGAYAMVRGDALLKLNRSAEAHSAYEEAQQDKDIAAQHPALDMLVDSTALAPLVDGGK